MKINKVLYSTCFARNFQSLPPNIRHKAISAEQKFRRNCFLSSLDTTHLKEIIPGYWVFSIDKAYRLLFEFCGNSGTVGFIDIANHSIYRSANDHNHS